MSDAPFLHSDALLALGIEHGLGTQTSERATVPGLVLVRQVHGTTLLRVPLAEPDATADALFTSDPGLAVGVRTADCVPLLLVHESRRGVAAVHAGWRGSAANMAGRAAREFAAALDGEPADLFAVVGPHIGPCCYEVDDPVRDAVGDTRAFSDSARAGHYMLDLGALNTEQLIAAGVPAARVQRVGGCTSCDGARYSSYRRDGGPGRMIHWVRMPHGRESIGTL